MMSKTEKEKYDWAVSNIEELQQFKKEIEDIVKGFESVNVVYSERDIKVRLIQLLRNIDRNNNRPANVLPLVLSGDNAEVSYTVKKGTTVKSDKGIGPFGVMLDDNIN